jgi:hypothetical protein
MADLLDGDRLFDELVVGDQRVSDHIAAAYRELNAEERALILQFAAAHQSQLRERDLYTEEHTVDRLVETGALEIAGLDEHGDLLFQCAELLLRYADTVAPGRGRRTGREMSA